MQNYRASIGHVILINPFPKQDVPNDFTHQHFTVIVHATKDEVVVAMFSDRTPNPNNQIEIDLANNFNVMVEETLQRYMEIQ
jgi:hypothetical protein